MFYGLQNVIKDVVAKGTLVFAAASNYGNMRRVTFPARMKNHVFCIFATNANAKVADSSLSFNPPGRPRCNNFAILGENIQIDPVPWCKPVSGTSYATSIAAGLAARLLDFSRQEAPKTQIRKLESLHSFEGMSAIFQKLAAETSASEYQCLRPWVLIESAKETESRQDSRQRVCEIISLELEGCGY